MLLPWEQGARPEGRNSAGSRQGDTVLGAVPAGPEGGNLAAWPGLVATRVQHYDAWLQDRQGSSRARGREGNQAPLWRSRSRLPSWGQAGPKWPRGDGAGDSRGVWRSGSAVSNGKGARSSSCRLALRTWRGVGPCWRRWQQHAASQGLVAGREPRPCPGEEMAAAASQHSPGTRREQPLQRCPGRREPLGRDPAPATSRGALISAGELFSSGSLSAEEGN